MSVTKELIEHERQQVQAGHACDVHLHKEGTFLRAYDWSAWLCCRLFHDFKVNKRLFKGIDAPVAYIGFPETSLEKWLPECVGFLGAYLKPCRCYVNNATNNPTLTHGVKVGLSGNLDCR